MPGNQLLANTTLASDEDSAVAGADPRDVVVDHLHRFRVTNDIRWAVAALELIVETSVFLQQRVTLLLELAMPPGCLRNHRCNGLKET